MKILHLESIHCIYDTEHCPACKTICHVFRGSVKNVKNVLRPKKNCPVDVIMMSLEFS